MIAFVLRTGKGATAYLPQDSQFQTGYLLWCVMLTLIENYCKSFLRFVSKLSTAEKEKTEDFRTLLYPPLAQILPHNRFPVNPWFTMNHGVQATYLFVTGSLQKLHVTFHKYTRCPVLECLNL